MSGEIRAEPMGVPLVDAHGLSKHYGTIRAVDGIDLTVNHGEILAIVGDNGAGKSTLIKMLSGAVIPDDGEIYVEGERARLHGPLDARALGIETIYQDLALLPNLDVVTNLYLGREEKRSGALGLLGVLARRRMRNEARGHLEDLRITIPSISGTPVERLSGGQRQSVAIARAIVWSSKLLIMDEPTAALGVAQSQAVLDLVQRVRERGTSVIIISHILPHVLALADRVAVLRQGRKVADLNATELSQDRLIALIVGFEDPTVPIEETE
jgi:ABC-type sugar transport system ATPase subunit